MAFYSDNDLKNSISDSILNSNSNSHFLHLSDNEIGLHFPNINFFMQEGFQLGFYLSQVNKKGWGTIYLRYRIGGKLYRTSTYLKARKDCWEKGNIVIRDSLNPLDRAIHINVSKCQNLLNKLGSEKILCNYALVEADPQQLLNSLKNFIMQNFKTKKSGKKVMLSLSLNKLIDELFSKQVTKNNYSVRVKTLKRFMRENQIEDDIKSVNQEMLRHFRDYLSKSCKATSANMTLKNICHLLKTLQQYDNSIRFNVDFDLIPPIKDETTSSDKDKGRIALTHEEVQLFKNLEELTDKERKSRDLFVVLCQSGIRFEDFPRLLNSKNHVEKNGVIYAVLDTEKRGVQASIPLNASKFYSDTLELMKPYIDDKEIISLKNSIETKSLRKNVVYYIRKLAKRLGLNRELIEISTIDKKQVQVSKPLYSKLSPHDCRHTFITNCVRVFNLIPSQIIGMSAHKDEKIIYSIYANLTKADKLNKVANVIETLGTADNNKNSTNQLVETHNTSDVNRGINGIEEGKRVLKYLGVDVTEENLTFEEIVAKVMEREGVLLDDYGVEVDVLKVLFNANKPMHTRIKALNSVLESYLS